MATRGEDDVLGNDRCNGHEGENRPERPEASPGARTLGWESPGFDDEELRATRDWLRSRGNTIEGGTSEVQLNIIAKRVLGLPD